MILEGGHLLNVMMIVDDVMRGWTIFVLMAFISMALQFGDSYNLHHSAFQPGEVDSSVSHSVGDNCLPQDV